MKCDTRIKLDVQRIKIRAYFSKENLMKINQKMYISVYAWDCFSYSELIYYDEKLYLINIYEVFTPSIVRQVAHKIEFDVEVNL